MIFVVCLAATAFGAYAVAHVFGAKRVANMGFLLFVSIAMTTALARNAVQAWHPEFSLQFVEVDALMSRLAIGVLLSWFLGIIVYLKRRHIYVYAMRALHQRSQMQTAP
jgi:hypothetical protein